MLDQIHKTYAFFQVKHVLHAIKVSKFYANKQMNFQFIPLPKSIESIYPTFKLYFFIESMTKV